MDHFVKIGYKISNIVKKHIKREYIDYMKEESLEAIIIKNSKTKEYVSFSLDYDEILENNLDEHSMEDFFDTVDTITFTFGYSLPNDLIISLKSLLMNDIQIWERKMSSSLKNIDGFYLFDIEYVKFDNIQDIYLNFNKRTNQ